MIPKGKAHYFSVYKLGCTGFILYLQDGLLFSKTLEGDLKACYDISVTHADGPIARFVNSCPVERIQ